MTCAENYLSIGTFLVAVSAQVIKILLIEKCTIFLDTLQTRTKYLMPVSYYLFMNLHILKEPGRGIRKTGLQM